MSTANEIVAHCLVSKLEPNPWNIEVGPPLTYEDSKFLKESIERDGIQIPLIVWRNGNHLIVLSGSNRLRIAKELGLKTVPVIIREFTSKDAAKLFAISDNLARRHLTTGQRAYLGLQYEELLAGHAGRPPKGDILPNLAKLNARESAAKKAGVSHGSLSAMKTIRDSGDNKLLQSVIDGSKTLHGAVHTIRSREKSNSKTEKPSRLTDDQWKERVAATTLIEGDCRKEMKKIDKASVDVIITDPPYPCIGKDYGAMTEEAWLDMMKTVVVECRRVLKPTGSAMFILQPNFKNIGAMRLWTWRFVLWAAEEWNLVQDAYWWCMNTLPSHAASRKVGLMRQSVKWCVWLGRPDCYRKQESVLWDISDAMASIRWEDRCLQRRPGGQAVNAGRTAQVAMERGGVTPFNLLPFAAANPNESVGHPASTPYALADWWCKYLLPTGGVLLDPFVGSGTMLLAGLDNGASKVIGVDKQKKYLVMAKRKIRS
ncbi:DNA methyltransferase [Methanoregula sp.]|jgi:DNA modification methylase|uniref:DNA methyltransferase n=1 Tax=Methanoregula sp. TaxID=2052170 RepID=UPI0035615262